MGRISELKRYRSILARRIPGDITDTLHVDRGDHNRVEDEESFSVKFRDELTGKLQFR